MPPTKTIIKNYRQISKRKRRNLLPKLLQKPFLLKTSIALYDQNIYSLNSILILRFIFKIHYLKSGCYFN